MKARRVALFAGSGVLCLAVLALGCVLVLRHLAAADPFLPLYEESCSVCHGAELEGAAQGPALVGVELRHGGSVEELQRSIAEGFPQQGMPGWSEVLGEAQVKSLAIYVAERRAGRRFTDFKVDQPLEIPDGLLRSQEHDFRIELVAGGLDPLPFSMAPLPDGRILVTEKQRGLRAVGPDGSLSELVAGTPEVHDGAITINQLAYGLGWMMEVALHPQFEENGWIYLHHGHLCRDCGDGSRRTMNRLVRGRIEDGRWVDEEVVWRAAPEDYTQMPDMGAGGRTTFDDAGHVYLSVGIKGQSNFDGIQDLSRPYGKIHRVHDDGRIPEDNPFVDRPDALPSTWSYGHRSPQGLEYDAATGSLWSTEMGPRGGDELNLLRPGRNYGWPLVSKGLDYDGTPVEYGKELGIEPDLAEIEQPVVDMTPSPAVSSFVVYRGERFPRWHGDFIVGTLKATELHRIRIDGEGSVHRETLIRDLARIRDVETGPDGSILLLLEHASGGRIVRLVPVR